MKRFIITAISVFLFSMFARAQSYTSTALRDTIRVLFENDKMKVTEYVSSPGKDVCGKGKHSHAPHLDIAMTDVKGTVITEDGKAEDFELKAGETFWNQAGTHIALNKGSKPARLYIVELK